MLAGTWGLTAPYRAASAFMAVTAFAVLPAVNNSTMAAARAEA